jgi:hypothetical protein
MLDNSTGPPADKRTVSNVSPGGISMASISRVCEAGAGDDVSSRFAPILFERFLT